MALGLREDLYRVKVTLAGSDGQKAAWVFDKFDGGDATAKDEKYRPSNGLTDELALGGASSISNITVSVIMTDDIYLWVPWMLTQVGRANMYVSKQPLDENGAPFGDALNYKGKLIACKPPKTDSMSETASILELEQSSVTPVTT